MHPERERNKNGSKQVFSRNGRVNIDSVGITFMKQATFFTKKWKKNPAQVQQSVQKDIELTKRASLVDEVSVQRFFQPIANTVKNDKSAEITKRRFGFRMELA